MSTTEALSKEEIDSLLQKESIIYQSQCLKPQNIDTYDFAAQGKQAMHTMAKLESLHERFCVEAALGSTQFIAQKILIKVQPIELMSLKEYLACLEHPVLIHSIHTKTMDGLILIVLSNLLTSNLVESLFGGKGTHAIEYPRELGPIESKIGTLFCDVLKDAMTRSWPDTNDKLEFQYVKTISNPSRLIHTIESTIIIANFEWIWHDTKSQFSLIYPQSIFKQLYEEPAPIPSPEEEKQGHDIMSHNLQSITMDLTAKTQDVTVSLQDILSIKVGDIIPIENPSYSLVTIGDVEVFSGKCTKNGTKRAIVIENRFME